MKLRMFCFCFGSDLVRKKKWNTTLITFSLNSTMSSPCNQGMRTVVTCQRSNSVRSNCARCLTIFLTVMFLLVGVVVTMVGNLAKPFWGPEHDRFCDFCRRDRLQTERNLRNCRIVGPIFLSLGSILLSFAIYQCHVRRKANAGQVLQPPSNVPSGNTFSTSQGTGGMGTTHEYPPPYGQTPAYGGGYNAPYGTGPIYPAPMQPPFQPQYPTGGYQQPPASKPPSDVMPPPPSYENAVGMTPSSPSAPPLEKVY